MRRLAAARELLDGDLGDTTTLDGNLRDLARVNRRFGGTDLSLRAIRSLLVAGIGDSGVSELRVLDVGTGAADIPLAIAEAPGPWRSVAVTAVDSRAEILDSARRVSPALAPRDDVALEIADGRRRGLR